MWDKFLYKNKKDKNDFYWNEFHIKTLCLFLWFLFYIVEEKQKVSWKMEK